MITTRIPIRPGWIVALITSVEDKIFGATLKERFVLKDVITSEGHSLKKTMNSTERLDPIEFQEATDLRLKLRSRATSHCVKTPWGLICDENRLEEMEAAVEIAASEIESFNHLSTHYQVDWSWRLGWCAGDKEREARAVRVEVTRLVDRLQVALLATDVLNRPKTIRDICGPLREMSKLLEPESLAEAALQALLKSARSTATALVKAGEDDAAAIEEILAGHEQTSLVSARAIFSAPAPSAPPGDAPLPSLLATGRVAALIDATPVQSLPPGATS